MTDPAVEPVVPLPAERFAHAGPEHCIAQREDGVYADPQVVGTTLVAAVDAILQGGSYFVGVDYPVLIKALYGHGPELPRNASGATVVRFAASIAPFAPGRRALYRAVKLADGQAEYYFEPVFMPGADGVEQPTRLDADEFLADLWTKGVRFGVDLDAIRHAIVSGAAGRFVVGRRLAPSPGVDAHVVEVSNDLHRSDAPRQLANGKLDLMSFQNRFPQIHKGERLLRKIPRSHGAPGFELSGIPVAPAEPADLDLSSYVGEGTMSLECADGEFLVAQRDGFLDVDPGVGRIAVTDKIVSRDGVSARTTGNLQLTADYEEFGEVQEQRIVEGEGVTVHADVYGHVVSRGGAIRLNRNLVGGSARNACGPIVILGVASGAVIQTVNGEVNVQRAENCVISGTRVRVEQAINCEILADEVEIAHAEGSAVAGRRVTIGCAAPKRQSEMRVFVLRPDCARVEEAIGQVGARIAQFGALAGRHRAALEALSGQPALRKYLMLARRVRTGELKLTAEQEPQFRRMAQVVAPALKEFGRLSQELKGLEAERQAGAALLGRLEAQHAERVGAAGVAIGAMQGEVQVRALDYEPDAGGMVDLPARDIRERLRGPLRSELLFAGASGSYRWDGTAAQDA
ncbi:flagellar assembly protein A [Massilia niastensis]|uniref:flagellar assembly protein A n=1 Tax=Massilia niastensis TaxID=544911 RepID=UPI00039D46CD|nr:flagellar assembly protein A [Massilia niastensis]